MYAYQNNILSIPARLLYNDWNLIAYSTYKEYCRRGKLINTNKGKGKGNQAWVSFHDLPVVKGVDLKAYCIEKLGKPEDVVLVNLLEEYITPDVKAIKFYQEHRRPNGKYLSFQKQTEKATNCAIFNAIETIFNDRLRCNKVFGRKKTRIWENISDAVNHLNHQKDGDGKIVAKWHYNLPSNPRALQRRYKEYLQDRYLTFLHKGEGLQNSKKVTDKIERLLVSLYCLPNKPYSRTTYEIYLQFIGGGELEVYDVLTGELYEREQFFDENNEPVILSEATVWNYLNKPENQSIIAKVRNGNYDFRHKVRPHVHRYAPEYSMSKITLDDRDIMHHKLPDGRRVMAYYAFDVMSGAMIGIAHSLSKNHDLFLACVRDMFRFTQNYGLGVPLELEVEQHLVSDFKEGLMKQGLIFSKVRWCNATNSQEKYAERLIGVKKYGVEKKRHQNVGRHYSKLDSNRVVRQKIFDETNNNYKFTKATYEEIVAWELEEQVKHNNELHSDQKKYPGKTRLEVFLENVHPHLPKVNDALLARYLGEHTKTSIRRNQYVTVQYGKYQLPNPQILSRLAVNNYKVDAYYLPENNEVKEVFLFQNDEYLCRCEPVPEFNRASAEWTAYDKQKYEEAMKYISKYDAWIKEKSNEQINKLDILKKTPIIDVECETVETPRTNEQEAVLIKDEFDTVSRALNDM